MKGWWDLLLKWRIEIYTYCEGKVASAGTLISIHGDKRFIGKNSVMLIHQISSGFFGKMNEIEDEMENLQLLMSKIIDMYKKNTKMKKRELDQLLVRDIWFDAKTCLVKGLVDEIL